VRRAAELAKSAGATRFCMGAAWRELKDRDVEKVVSLVSEVRELGLETCMTLGMITDTQAQTLKEAGLDYYNHNVDTSPEYYDEVVTTRTYNERLETLDAVRGAGIKVCSGGIIGMGEKETDRAGMLETLANLDPHPESVPINMLVVIPGTPLEHVKPLEPLDWVRTIAVARILMPKSYVRLSAGRSEMSDETQAMCFFAGANSIFYGEKLLTTGNPDVLNDQVLFDKLGLKAEPGHIHAN
jgi:biotin synthase